LILTNDGTTSNPIVGSKLAILLNGTTLSVNGSGLEVSANGITPTQLNSSTIANGLQGAAGTAISVKANTGITVTTSGVGLDLTYADGRYVNVAGDTLTGALVLSGAPTAGTLQAATALYAESLTHALAVSLDTQFNAVEANIAASYYLYTSTGAATTHTVTHNIGVKYVAVTVADSSGNVIMPQSIVFNTTTGLTVTFNAAIDCNVVCVGISPTVNATTSILASTH
jgi:hypothetical protein